MKNSANAATLLKAIDKKLKTILEEDIRKFTDTRDIKNKNAAFLQLIAA
jgi:hypothetical protein